MNANGECLLNQSTTSRASLGCVARVNQNDFTTSVFCFVRDVPHELTPGGIRDAFRQTVILKHTLSVQFLKSDDAVFIDHGTREFVSEILSAVSNPPVDVLYCPDVFSPLGRAFGSLRKFALCLRQFFLVAPKEARVRNLSAIGECCEIFKTNVNADCLIAFWEHRGFYFTRETRVPIADSISADSQCLDCSPNGTVQDDSDCPNSRQVQLIALQLETALWIGETVIASFAAKAGVAWLLACFYAPEECLERKVNSCANVLEDLRIDMVQFWLSLFPLRQHLDRVVACNSLMLLLPSVLAGCKCLVVHPAAQFKRVLQCCALRSGWA